MAAPRPSDLDFSQCIQGAYDDAQGRLRVEGQATIVNGALEVSINATDDNIAIKDPSTGNVLHINNDGSINVSSSGGGGNSSVGLTGVTAPISATEVGGINPSGNLTSLKTDANGQLLVSGVSQVTGTVTTEQAGLNSFQTEQYLVGAVVMQLTPTPLSNRSSITIRVDKNNAGAIYIGNDNTVTINTGYPLFSGDTLGMDLTSTNNIFAISDTAGQKLAVLEIA